MAELITANGFSLRQPWCDVEDFGPLFAAPAARGDNQLVPGRHGTVRTPNKRYTDTRLTLPVRVLGVDPVTGGFVSDGVSQLHTNRDTLLRVFHADTILLEHTLPNGESRSVNAELMGEPSAATRARSYPPMSRIEFDLCLWEGFWFDTDAVSQIITGPTGTVAALTTFASATAPMADLTLTFTGPVNNPQVNFGTGFVKYNGVVASGRKLVIDTGTWQVSPGTGTVWSPDPRQVEFAPGPRWLELNPSVSPFEVTFFHTGGGSASFALEGRRKYLTP